MIKLLSYVTFLLRHKWHVGVGCWRHGLYWQALTHDWDKFLPDVLFTFADRGVTEVPLAGTDPEYDRAYITHQNRSRHHWQYWVMWRDNGAFTPVPMPERYVREMVCDWEGATKARGNGLSPLEWYGMYRHLMVLHPLTRIRVQRALGYGDER